MEKKIIVIDGIKYDLVVRQERPPIGIKPEWLCKEERLKEIDEAYCRYMTSGFKIPQEWLVERMAIGHWLNDNRKSKELSKEKDYEILSLRKYDDGFVKGYVETTLRSNGKYLNDANLIKDGYYTLELSLENGWVIHSVRRISDGEVFTLNQEVEYVETN